MELELYTVVRTPWRGKTLNGNCDFFIHIIAQENVAAEPKSDPKDCSAALYEIRSAATHVISVASEL